MTEQRREPRYAVNLVVRYPSAAEFVADYVENLSKDGLFVRGAHELPLGHECDVEIVLPGQGEWKVRARVKFVLSPEAAQFTGRNAGAGMQVFEKPIGFDDALLGYLLRLGRRRDVMVMVGDNVPGGKAIENAGYRVAPLAAPIEIERQAQDAGVPLVAIVVAAADADAYLGLLQHTELAERVFAVAKPAEIPDVIARIDSLL